MFAAFPLIVSFAKTAKHIASLASDEIPISSIAVAQKRIMKMAGNSSKPVITATQMLESMTEHRRPTRAEATDVANAILDGTDAVMLSGESAMGKYPIDATLMLAEIASTTEPHRTIDRNWKSYRMGHCRYLIISSFTFP